MAKTSEEAIASYFDDLLTDTVCSENNVSASFVQASPATEELPTPAPIRELAKPFTPLALSQVAEMDRGLTALEDSKKQQLQSLLNSHMLIPPVEEQRPVVESKPERPLVPIDKDIVEEASAPVAGEGSITSVDSPYLAWAENGRPVWAQKAFDVLLFQVGGLTLAVPLIALGQIYPVTDELAPVFGQIGWFMGFQPTRGGPIRTVNTALFVMPERYDPHSPPTAKYVISIDGMDWGLAVDQVRHPATLQPEDVTWRCQRGKRPWLAGTVKSAMCALIDIPQMGQLLQSHDQNRNGSN